MIEVYYNLTTKARHARRWLRCRLLHRHTWGWEIARVEGRTRIIRGACMICGKDPDEVVILYPKIREGERE